MSSKNMNFNYQQLSKWAAFLNLEPGKSAPIKNESNNFQEHLINLWPNYN